MRLTPARYNLLDNGSAMCWGSNSNGQLGNGSSGTDNATPGNVPGLQSVKSISVGGTHTCAVLDSGSAMCWGLILMDNLGMEALELITATPGNVPGLQSVKSISAGYSHTCAVLDNGSAMCWVRNTIRGFMDNLGMEALELITLLPKKRTGVTVR